MKELGTTDSRFAHFAAGLQEAPHGRHAARSEPDRTVLRHLSLEQRNKFTPSEICQCSACMHQPPHQVAYWQAAT